MRLGRLPVLLLAIAVFALLSCAGNGQDRRDTGSDPPVLGGETEAPTPEQEPVEPVGPDVAVGAVGAFSLYEEKYPGTNIYKVELEKDRDVYIYEVKGFDDDHKYEIKIDASTGALVKQKAEVKDMTGKKMLAKSAVEKVETLVNDALRDAGTDAALSEWSLEHKWRKPLLEVEIRGVGQKDIEYKYDVATGQLLEIDD